MTRWDFAGEHEITMGHAYRAWLRERKRWQRPEELIWLPGDELPECDMSEYLTIPGSATMASCECAKCGRKFSGVTCFDKHQDIDYGRSPPVLCRSPEDFGMRLDEHGRWGWPLSAARREAFRKMQPNRPSAE